MPRIQYAFRDDVNTVSLLVQGCAAPCSLCQIATLHKKAIAPEFLNQYFAIDIKKSAFSVADLTDLGRSIKVTDKHRYCLMRIVSQIEFSVKPRLMQKLAEFFPAYTASGLYKFFAGQPTGYIIVLHVFKIDAPIPDGFMEKARRGSSRIIRFYDEAGDPTFFDAPEPTEPVVDFCILEHIKDEIIHKLRVENALIGVYGDDVESKRLLQEKHNTYKAIRRQFNWLYDEDANVDKAIVDYNKIYQRVLEKDPSLREFIDYVRNIKAPQMGEWRVHLTNAISGDCASRTRLIEMYLRNVVRTALYYSDRYDLPIADIIQDGTIGLIRSVEKFDTSKSPLFTTYFLNWVRQSIQIEMPHYMHIRHFSSRAHVAALIIRELAEEQCISLSSDPEERISLIPLICEKMDIKEDIASSLLDNFVKFISLEDVKSDDKNLAPVSTTLICDYAFVEYLIDCEEKAMLQECLMHLSDRERQVLVMRYGFGGNAQRTLAEIGQVLGVSRERVRQIEMSAIKRIKRSSFFVRFFETPE